MQTSYRQSDTNIRNRDNMGNSSSGGLGSFIDTNSQRIISDKPKRSFTRPIKNLYMRRRFPKLSPMVLKNMNVIVSPNCDDKIQRKRKRVEQREPSEIDERSKLSLSVVKEELKPKPSKVKKMSRMLAELFPHNELGLKPDPYDIDVTGRLRTTQLPICKEEPSLVESPRKKRKVETSKTEIMKTKVSLKFKKEAKSTPRRRGKRMLLCLAPHNNYSMKDTQLKNTTGRRARAKKDISLKSKKEAKSTPRRRGKRMLLCLAPHNNYSMKDTQLKNTTGRRARAKKDVRVPQFRSTRKESH